MLVILPEEIINISKASDFPDELRKISLNNGEFPYIQIMIEEDNNHKCIMGYINQDGVTKINNTIWVNKVCIKNIAIAYESNHDEVISAFAIVCADSYWVKYKYSITIKLGSIEHTFNCEDKLEFARGNENNDKYRLIRRYGNHMLYFFSTIVPRINELVDEGVKEWNINFDFYGYLLESESKEIKPYNVSRDDVIRLVYRLDLSNESPSVYNNSTYFVKAKPGKNVKFLNYYIGNLVGSIINANFIKDTNENGVIYKWELKETSCFLKLNPNALKDHLLRILIIGIFFNYNQELADNGFIYGEKVSLKKEVKPNTQSIRLLNFMINMRATRWLHGSYRVGRDDIEWSVESVYFPALDYHPSRYLINLINETLNIKLELDENNLCFSYIEASDSEYVPWLARNEDIGSFDFQNTIFVKLVNRLLPLIESNSASFFEPDY